MLLSFQFPGSREVDDDDCDYDDCISAENTIKGRLERVIELVFELDCVLICSTSTVPYSSIMLVH